MSAEPPPSGGNAGFNPDDWTNANDPIDNQFLAANYLQFPLAQGAETLANTTVSGVLTVQDTSTFADLATFNNGIDITTTAGITFSDTTVQTTAFIEANYAQLNTDNIFLAPYQNTFQGNASTGNANAPLKLTNGVAGEYATLYLNPSSGEDITLYTNQNPNGGLTIRGANDASFTMNPATVQDGVGCLFTNPLSMNGNTLSGLNNVYGNGGTITFQNVANFNSGATLTTTPTAIQTTNVANVAYVNNSISTALVPYSTTTQMNSAISTALTPYALINSQQFTGTPTLQTTPTAGITSPSAIANLQYITNQGFAPLASPAFSGTPTAPTQPLGDNSTAIATTAFVLANQGTPVLTNYAQLNTATAQTFTGAIAFSGSTTAITPPNLDNSTKIATTAFLNDALNGYTTFITTTTTNNVRLVPTLMSFKQVYFDAQYQNEFYLTTVATTASSYGSISFTIPLPSPLYPNGANPTIDSASYINLVDGNGNSYNFVLSFFNDIGINCNANGAGISSYNLTISGQIFISWTY
jgi:hypothetical protein